MGPKKAAKKGKKGRKKGGGSDLDSVSVLSNDSGTSISTLGSVSATSLKGGPKKKKKKKAGSKTRKSTLVRKASKASVLSEK